MPLVSIPNVSEGRDRSAISELQRVLETAGCRVLDVHADAAHNRSVFTVAGSSADLTRGLAELARAAARLIDLRKHAGAHPRVGALDVCPIVPHRESMEQAVETARATGAAIAERAGLPVYFYDYATTPPRSLPEIRAGGLEALIERAALDYPPDAGPRSIDPRSGVVCVGARDALIAFNVWLRTTVATARAIADVVRERNGGLPGVRAIGLELGPDSAQVSMNLTQPDVTGLAAAFAAVSSEASRAGAIVEATEIVGLVPERYLPSPDAEAARLLIEPGRSLESVLD